MKELVKPHVTWGPMEEEHRVEFLQALTEDAGRVSSSHSLRANAPTPATRYGANELNSAQLLGRVLTESNFFHSKLSLAEKLTEKQARDLVNPNSQLILFQNPQILRTISSGYDVIHTPAPFPVWGLIMSNGDI